MIILLMYVNATVLHWAALLGCSRSIRDKGEKCIRLSAVAIIDIIRRLS